MLRAPKSWLSIVAFTASLLCACSSDEAAGVARALTGRGKIAVVGGADLRHLGADGAELVDVSSSPALKAAAFARNGEALAAALAQAGYNGVLVDARPQALEAAPDSVAGKLAGYARVPGFTGAYLSPLAALYTLDPTRGWSDQLRTGIAEVARRLVAGEEAPRLTSFPEALRRVEPVEVMVLLRSGKQARLWRSARGSSFARALLTAASVARKRWMEREQAMGGPLDKQLPALTVEVSLLEDDGEIGSRERGFVDRVVTAEHGVAYERKGAWRYYLPEATHAEPGEKPSSAYARLFAEDALPEDSLRSLDLRPYRMAVRVVGVSEGRAPAPPPKTKDEISDVADPAEVLGKSK